MVVWIERNSRTIFFPFAKGKVIFSSPQPLLKMVSISRMQIRSSYGMHRIFDSHRFINSDEELAGVIVKHIVFSPTRRLILQMTQRNVLLPYKNIPIWVLDLNLLSEILRSVELEKFSESNNLGILEKHEYRYS